MEILVQYKTDLMNRALNIYNYNFVCASHKRCELSQICYWRVMYQPLNFIELRP